MPTPSASVTLLEQARKFFPIIFSLLISFVKGDLSIYLNAENTTPSSYPAISNRFKNVCMTNYSALVKCLLMKLCVASTTCSLACEGLCATHTVKL